MDNDVIVFVVHSPGHYALWIACNTQQVFQSDDSENIPFLVSLDSLTTPRSSFGNHLQNHIVYAILNCATWYTAQDMEGGMSEGEIGSIFNNKTLPCHRIKGPPRQKDGHSCGPLTLMNYHALMCAAADGEKLRFATPESLSSYFTLFWESLSSNKESIANVTDAIIYFRSELISVLNGYINQLSLIHI